MYFVELKTETDYVDQIIIITIVKVIMISV